MQVQPTVDGVLTPQSHVDVRHGGGVPMRSVRRATARRASNRRATARQRKDDVEGRIIGYLKDHPQSSIGDLAKALNASRGAIATGRSHMLRASEIPADRVAAQTGS